MAVPHVRPLGILLLFWTAIGINLFSLMLAPLSCMSMPVPGNADGAFVWTQNQEGRDDIPSDQTIMLDRSDTQENEKILIDAAILTNPWNLSIAINPYQMACNVDIARLITNSSSTRTPKMELHHVCNEGGTDCQDEWVEVGDEVGPAENGAQFRNALMDSCQNVTESFQRDKSGYFVLCYESALDPKNSNGIKSQFHLNNDGDNSLAAFCNKKDPIKVRHGIGMQFWVTRNKADRHHLLVHAQIYFSFKNSRILLAIKKQKIGSANSEVIYNFLFRIKSTLVGGTGKEMPDFSVKEGDPSLADGMHALQKKASLWLVYLDMAATAGEAQAAAILYLIESNCHKYRAIVNGQTRPKKCNTDAWFGSEEERRNEEFVRKTMAEVHELEKNCHYKNPSDPELKNRSHPPSEIEGHNDGEQQHYDDIVYRPEEAQKILDRVRKECGKVQNNRRGRSIGKRQINQVLFKDYTDPEKFTWSTQLWDPAKFPIPYTFQYFHNEEWIRVVLEGILKIMKKTCITFKYDPTLNDAADKISSSYMRFIDEKGCFSGLGRYDGANNVDVVPGACPAAKVAHEIMHRLGIEHEHERNDQHNFVWIRHEAIEAYHYAFDENKLSKSLGTSYDFGSIMHYGSYYFGEKNKGYTIVAKERAYQQTMGQRIDLSFKDAKLLNRMYCHHVCPSKLLCANGGYTDPMDCSKCRCPYGFRGIICDRYDFGEKKCHSGRFYADIIPKYIETTDVMDDTKKCFWTIKTVQVTQRILIRIFALKNFDCRPVCPDEAYLEVHTKKDKSSRGARLCCANELPYTFLMEPGVDALIILKRTKNDQQFQLSYETPDAIFPEKPVVDNYACKCTKAYNPWHKPGDEEEHTVPMDRWYYKIGIKSRSDLIVNGKYRFHTQNGSAWFNRFCVVNKEASIAYGTWTEPISGTRIRLDDIVSEACVTDYYASGCEEMSNIWKEFSSCLVDGNAPANCKGAENFSLERCTVGSGTYVPVEQNSPF